MLPDAYLRGVALFNAGEFYECHEVLEESWRQAAGDERALLHALIQAAAALHHYQRGNLKGAASVHTRAEAKLRQLPASVMHIKTTDLALDLQRFFEQATSATNSSLPFPKIHLNYDDKT